jgi:type III secretion protein R
VTVLVVLAATLAMPAASAADQAEISSMVSTLGVAALLAILPILIITATSFIKISVVLAILRSALGARDVPPTLVLTALAAVLTMFVMAPVGQEMVEAVSAVEMPLKTEKDPIGLDRAKVVYRAASPPLRKFLKANAPKSEVKFYKELAGGKAHGDDLRILLPAFATGEIVEAFLMGFLVFIPFLIIDLIVGAVLLALGMHMLSPTAISLPLKLLLLVAVDGWHIILKGILVNYAV